MKPSFLAKIFTLHPHKLRFDYMSNGDMRKMQVCEIVEHTSLKENGTPYATVLHHSMVSSVRMNKLKECTENE
ncbi:hypothetical protein KIN20_027815 [Parelaphostrongylus tenuis]|uniref:Uncharacterized protein n=1 Tax=Parelaphostrongylus tenuis TaxID=148309 RepID=A0AAD5QZU0_PARTN|nr:hypothetical protein KIN20_027815 [Parelaphostrongylus tenuis]